MRISLLAAVAWASITTLSAADYAAAAVRRQTHIPAQSLGSALEKFATDRNLQLIYATDEVNRLGSSGASGNLSADEALRQLLKGTGLSYQFLDEKTVTVQPVVDPSSASGRAGESALSRGGEGTSEDSRGLWERFRLARAEATDNSENQNQTEQKSDSSSDETDSSDSQLEEIIVTAQKREEKLQDVPISITVLRGAELDKSTSQGVIEALTRVPGVGAFEGFQTGGPQISVRGVAAVNNVIEGANPIAYYLDSVPFAFVKSAITPDASAYDMAQVEVLRGPQSTLYGASAQNGVVRILTKDADLDAFEAKVRTSGSQTKDGGGNYRADAVMNMPIVQDKLAARAVVGYQSLSGWIDKPNDEDANDGIIRNYRLKVNAQPTEDLSIGASAWVSRADFGGAPASQDDRTHRSQVAEPIKTDYDVFGLKIEYDFGNFALLANTGYIDYTLKSELDTNFTAVGSNTLTTNLANKLLAQEVYLRSTHEGAWRWSVGAMYRDAEDDQFQLRHTLTGAPTGGYLQPLSITFLSESRAIFGELTRIFADGAFELTGGLRYFEDDVGQREHSRFNNLAAIPINTDSTFTATSPRLVLTWHVWEQMTAYASYSEGFRSGVDQTPTITALAPGIPPAKPDTLRNYEIGAKGNLFSGRLLYDTAVYFMDWQDVQRNLNIIYQTSSQSAAINSGSASGLGFDLGLTARATDALTFNVNYSVNNLEQDSDILTRPTLTDTIVAARKGDRLPMSPEYTLSGGFGYVFPLGRAGYGGEFSASVNRTSERARPFLSGTTLVNLLSDKITLMDATFTVKSPHGWEVSLFGDNLADEDGAAARHFALPEWTSRVRPRTVGLQFAYSF